MLQPVVNATGVLLHTNLGRAPLAVGTDGRASNIELDLATGKRGSRTAHAGTMLARAVDAEAAVVVNNCAAAVLLTLAALAGDGRGVAVSRGELVEIGGGFRVPDVMTQSGARLLEVGTTNRTRVADYRAAMAAHDDLAILLKVHRSNYTISGFTEETSVPALAGLGPPVVVDLGSGLLDAGCPWLDDGPPAWLRDEPAAKQTLAAGADLVMFSGDKLLAGPQAGIIAGRADLVRACAKHPLYRAFRPGALVLSALQEVALSYLDRTAGELPFWRMASASVASLEARARGLVDQLPDAGVEVVACASVPGGGTLPGADIPSVGVALDGDRTAQLRAGAPPVIARVEEGRTILDLRTVEPADDDVVLTALRGLDGL
jgi:L-seryl-tRNA(Ser) seleniumtransferase